MEDLFWVLLIIAIVVFLIAWWFVLPIRSFVVSSKYKNLQNRTKQIYLEGHLSDDVYTYISGELIPKDLKKTAKKAREKLSEQAEQAPGLLKKAKGAADSESKAEPIPGLASVGLAVPKATKGKGLKLVPLDEPKVHDNADVCLRSVPLAIHTTAQVGEEDKKNAVVVTENVKEAVQPVPVLNAVLLKPAEDSANHLAVHLESPVAVKEGVQNVVPVGISSLEQAAKPEAVSELVAQGVENTVSKSVGAVSEREAKLDKPLAVKAEAPIEQKATENVPAEPERSDKHLQIILFISVSMFCIAGFSWIGSRWAEASINERLLQMASFIVIFFGAFALAHKVLRIPNSARAFYVLGVASVGTTAIGAELLGLVLGDCALSTQFLLPTALMAIGMYGGYKIFKTPLFIILTCALAYTFLTSLSASIFSSGWMFSVLPAIFAFAAFVGLRFCKPQTQEKLKVYVNGWFIISVVLVAISGFAVQAAFESTTVLVFSIATYLAVVEKTWRQYSVMLNIGLTAGITWIIYLANKSFSIPSSVALLAMLSVLVASFVVSRFCAKRSVAAAHSQSVEVKTDKVEENADLKAVAVNGEELANTETKHVDVKNEETGIVEAKEIVKKESKKSSADLEFAEYAISITEMIAVVVVSCIVDLPNMRYFGHYHNAGITYSCLAWLVPSVYFLFIGYQKSSIGKQIFHLIPAFLLLILSFTFAQNAFFEIIISHNHYEWILYLAYALPIIGMAVVPDGRIWGKRIIREYYAIVSFIMMALAMKDVFFAGSMLCVPGLFCLFAGNRKEDYWHKGIFYLSALVFLPIACNYLMMHVGQGNSYEFSIVPAIWLNLGYVVFAFALASISNGKAFGKRIDREHFATLLLIILGTIILFKSEYRISELLAIIPLGGALALTVHESIWLKRHDVRIVKQISAAMIYVIATVICLIVVHNSRYTLGFPLQNEIVFPFLTALAAIPIFVENFICYKSEKRPYRYIILIACGIFALISLVTVIDDRLAYPLVSLCMLTGAGLVAMVDRKAKYFSILYLTALGIASMAAYKVPVLCELIPFGGALALSIYESIYSYRKNIPIIKQLSVAMVYIVSTIILCDIADNFAHIFKYNLDFDVIYPFLTALMSIPILIETLVCSKSEKRPYEYLTLAACGIASLVALVMLGDGNIAYPLASICMLTGAAVVASFNRKAKYYATPYLLVLGGASILKTGIPDLFELIPFTGALALSIHESIWTYRHDARSALKQLSVAMIYVISTIILFDIAVNSARIFGFSILVGAVCPFLVALTAIPILVEHLLCSKSEKRPYRYLTYVAWCIPAVFTIGMIMVVGTDIDEVIYPISSSLMLAGAGMVGAWCINRREHQRYGFVLAASIYAGLYLLFTTLWPNHEIFGLPSYFIYIFLAVLGALMAFFDGYKFKGYTPMRVIWGISAFPLMVVTHDTWHVAHVAGVVVLASNLLQYLTDSGHSVRDRVLITVSVGLVAVALSLKLALLSESITYIPTIIRPPLIALIPVVASYLLARFTWSFNKPAHQTSFILMCIATMCLFAADKYSVFANDVVITVLALASIVISMVYQCKRYLAFGCTFILLIFFSHTKSFWLDLHWWAYLAIVATLLTAFAVTNEVLSRKGSSVLKKVKENKINQWKW